MNRSLFRAAFALATAAGLTASAVAQTDLHVGGANLGAGFHPIAMAVSPSLARYTTWLTGGTNLVGNNGIGASATLGGAMADDFTVPCGTVWTLNEIKAYCYTTGAVAPTVTAASIAIYNGDPRAGGTLIFGDYDTNRMTSVNFASFDDGINGARGLFRQGGAANGDATNRAYQEMHISAAGAPVLGPGTYWVVICRAATANTFVPGSSPLLGSDNGILGTISGVAPARTVLPAAWVNWTDTNAVPLKLGMPFIVNGTQTGTPCPVPPTVDATMPALVDDAFVDSGAIVMAVGDKKFVKVVISDIDAAANTALDIDTVGSDAAMNTNIALFKGETFGDAGARVANDNDGGPGTHSQLSFGKPMRQFSTEGALGAGNMYDGANGATLAAGTYYVAITNGGAATTFGATGYTTATSGGIAGNAHVRVRKVPAQATITAPLSQTAIVDAGTLVDGVPLTVSTEVNAFDVKWIKVQLPAGALINATQQNFTYDMEGSTLAPANSAAMALFKADGTRAGTGASSGRFGGTGFLSKQSWGLFSAVPGKPEDATSMGFFSSGFTGGAGTVLDPSVDGAYYLAIIPNQPTGVFGGATFNVTPRNAGNSAAAGQMKINFYYNSTVTPATAPTGPNVTELTLVPGTRVSTPPITVKKGGVHWVHVTVPEDIFPSGAGNNSALDIDLAGSNVLYTNGGVTRCTVYLYNGTGAWPAGVASNDDFNAPAVYGALSYGSGVRSYVAAASRANGASSQLSLLPGGEYYIAIVPFDGTNGGTATGTNWNGNSRAAVNTAAPSTAVVNVAFYANDGGAPVVTPPIADADLGTVNIAGGAAGTYVQNATPALDISARDVRWFKFTTASALTTGGTEWLDIDSNGYAAQLAFMAMYDNAGVLIKTSRGNDPATPLVTQAQMNFGSTSPTGRFAVTGGANDFASSTDLPAGTYWVAFTRWNNGAAVSATNPGVGNDWDLTGTHNFVAQPTVFNLRTNLPVVGNGGCQPADIADDTGAPLPSANSNTGVNEGDYNAFFAGFFDALAYCDQWDDAGNPLPSAGTNSGVNEGDYNGFFATFFNGCP